jgi:hypothetical protein
MLKNAAAILAALVALACSPVSGQDLEDLLGAGENLWSNQIIPGNPINPPGLLYGNGVSIQPDGKSVISTSVGGTVTSFGALSGAFEWEYVPPADGALVRSHSNMVFTTDNAAEPYMVYSVVYNESLQNPYS